MDTNVNDPRAPEGPQREPRVNDPAAEDRPINDRLERDPGNIGTNPGDSGDFTYPRPDNPDSPHM